MTTINNIDTTLVNRDATSSRRNELARGLGQDEFIDMHLNEDGSGSQGISRRGFGEVLAAGGAGLLLSGVTDAGELSNSPTENLTFNKFKPVEEKEIPKDMTDVNGMVIVAHEHGLISDEVGNTSSKARKVFIAAIESTGKNRASKLRPMILSLSNLVQDKILTETQARDFLMKHWHTASFIATHLDKDSSGERRLDPQKAKQYYEALMQINEIRQGDRLEDTLKEESSKYVKDSVLARLDNTKSS
jgi:hypothetical protein